MDAEIKQNVARRSTWMRGLYMLLFAIIYSVAELVGLAVVVFQFAATLFSGRTNTQLRDFGHSLSVFIYQIWLFLTFNTEVLPFPFADWPQDARDARPPTPRTP